MSHNSPQFLKRCKRVRTSLKNKSKARLRLSIFRSKQHIYAQIIDDIKGITIVSASTLDKELTQKVKKTSNIEAAKEVGFLIGKRAKDANATNIVFDRGGYLYHGRVQALAEGAREAGLSF